MSDITPTDAPEPQSVSEVSGTLSRIAAEAAAAPEPAADVPDPVDDLPVDVPDEPVLEELDVPAPEAGAELEPEAPAGDDPFAEFGGKDTVQAALKLHQATQSEDGIVQLLIEAAQALNVPLDKVEALFADQPAAPAPAAGEPEYDYDEDPDRPVTLRELREAEAARQQAAQQAAQQAKVEAARQSASKVVADTVTELGLTMEDEAAQIVLTLGNKYLPNGSLDPTVIANAVKRGHADYTALVERERQAYIASKRKAADTVPTAPAGNAAPSTPAPAEPKDTAEAIKIARKRLGL